MKIKIYFMLFFLFACATKSSIDLSDIDNELNQKLVHGKELFEKEKFTRAKDDFDYILLNDRGSNIGLEARFYQAECLYMLEQLDEAISSYEKVLNYSSDSNQIEMCKFKICECYFNLSNTHNRDQMNNNIALEKLQYFMDQYPSSGYISKSEEYISTLRLRKAQKVYETARLYLKLKEFDSALIYFNDILKDYYDTSMADEARISIIFLYLVKDEEDLALLYYNSNKTKFINKEKEAEANNLLNSYSDKSNWLSNLIRLYK